MGRAPASRVGVGPALNKPHNRADILMFHSAFNARPAALRPPLPALLPLTAGLRPARMRSGGVWCGARRPPRDIQGTRGPASPPPRRARPLEAGGTGPQCAGAAGLRDGTGTGTGERGGAGTGAGTGARLPLPP